MKDRLILWMMLLVVAAWAIPAPEIRSESTETHGYQEKHTGILWPTEGWRTARPDNGGRIPSAKSFTSVLLGIAIDNGLNPGADIKLCQKVADEEDGGMDVVRFRSLVFDARMRALVGGCPPTVT